MTDVNELAAVLGDLVDAMHFQAKELERLASHLERETVRLPEPSQISVVVSELSELQVRLRRITGREENKTASATP